MSELLIILLLTAGVCLWMLGGTYWRPMRWVLWPLVAVSILTVSGVVLWKASLVGLSLAGVNTLPYGERTSWPVRLLVFSTYVFPSVWLGLQGLLTSLVLTVGLLTVFMWLSRTMNRFTWKLWEAEAGLLQAMSLVIAVL